MEIARKGEGKHGGYRTVVLFKSEFRTFFVYGFPKSKTANIGEKDLKKIKEDAKDDFSLTDEQINQWLRRKTLIEVL